MNVIVCVDDNYGMMFNDRRQSRDREVIKDILDKHSDFNVYMSEYSKELFDEYGKDINVSNNFLFEAKDEDYCFVEDNSLKSFETEINKIIMYMWNRIYPSDIYFDIDLSNYRLVECREIKGYSHDKITKKVFIKIGKGDGQDD